MASSLLVKTATAAGATVPLPLNKPRTRAAAAAATATIATRWRKQQPTSLPPLLQRPQQPSPTDNSDSLATLPITKTVTTDSKTADSNHDKDHRNSGGRDDTGGVSATATDVLRLMDALQLTVDEDTYISLVKECTDSRDVAQGHQLHEHIQKRYGGSLLGPAGILLANRLLLMHAVCGWPDSAYRLFDQMRFRDAITWATVIAVLSVDGRHRDALQLFAEMRAGEPSHCFSDALLVVVIRSCAELKQLGAGQQVHCLALKAFGNSGAHCIDLARALVQLYSTLRCYHCAQQVLAGMCFQDTAAWTCLITGYCRQGQFEKAFDAYRKMGKAGGRKNSHAISSMLKACGRIEDEGQSGRQVHAEAVKLGLDSDQFVGSSLLDMYAKHGLLGDARGAFDMIRGSSDAVCWSAMLHGYARRGSYEEAFRLLQEMKAAGTGPGESLIHVVRAAFRS